MRVDLVRVDVRIDLETQSFLSLFLFGKERMHSTDQGLFTGGGDN